MKKVLEILIKDKEGNWKHHQFLMKSESRFCSQLTEDFGEIKVRQIEMEKATFNTWFGK